MPSPHLQHIPVHTAQAHPEQHDATLILYRDLSLDTLPEPLRPSIQAYVQSHTGPYKKTTLLPCPQAEGGRLILAPTGPLDRDWDDVRSIADAAGAAAKLACEAGATRLKLIISSPLPQTEDFDYAHTVALLGAAQALWVPLEAREHQANIETVTHISVHTPKDYPITDQQVQAMEAGRRLARDLCGTQAERMTPRAFADYCQKAFASTDVAVTVVDDLATLNKDYPLMMAVARASLPVQAHQPCVLRLHYKANHANFPHAFFAGKGVTYDTGGADLKTGGHMAGMSRDKGGAAAVAGLFLSAALLKPEMHLTAEIGLVRNSIGAFSFVTDEIITSHAGKRVRIGNTDAEGRLLLADCLSHLRQAAEKTEHAHLYSIATLTGHALLAMGPYSALIDNGAARRQGTSEQLKKAGKQWGDPCEISSLQREDIQQVDPKSEAEDLLSCNSKPSSQTPRGHQLPMAFLMRASGLEQHGMNSPHPMPYTHIDIGGSAVENCDWAFGKPTAAPLLALLANHLEHAKDANRT